MKNTKRLVSLFLSGIIIFSLVSCGLTDNIKNKMIDSDSKNAFSYAVNNGNLELFKELCEKYPDFDLDSISSSNTLLMNLLYTANCPRNIAYQMADIALENGADLYMSTPNGSSYIYNSVTDYEAVGVDNLQYLSSKGVDLRSVDDDILGNLLECCIDNNVNNLNSFKVFDYLTNQGLTVRKEFIEKEGLESKYYKFIQSPKAIQYVVSQYIDNGGTLDLPDYLTYAVTGDIENALEAAKGSAISDDEFEVLFTYTQAFGTVKQYEKLLGIYGKEWSKNPAVNAIVSCDNAEMLEYFIKDIMALEKTKEYNLNTDCFDVAAYYHYYDIFDVLINNGYDLYDDFLEKPLYGILGSCICSNDYDFDEFLKLYDYMEKKHEPINENYAANLFSDKIDLKSAKKYIDFFIDEKGIDFHLLSASDVQYDVAEYLYKKGRTLQAYDLSDAIRSQDLELIKLVQSQGADLNQLWYDFKDGDEWSREFDQCPEYTEQLEDTSHPNFTPRPSNFEMNINSINSEIVKYLIDNSMEIPDNALETAVYASKATVKVLIDAGADTDLKFDKLEPANGGGIVQKGDFDLVDYYKHYGRDDLAELL